MRCKSSIVLLILILPLIALIVFLTPADIQAVTNTTEIEVNISEVSQISVTPAQISWTQVAPGGNGSVQTITIENLGSTSFSSGVYVEADSYGNITNNPTAGDDVTKYMAGSFLVMKNSSYGDTEYWFVNQISWNETNYPNPASPTSGAISWGWYNNASDRWMWELVNGSDGTCRNSTGAGLKVQPTRDSASLAGATSATFIANTTEWSTWTITTGPLVTYCLAASTDCERLMIYRYDANSSLPTCTNSTYLLPGALNPGAPKYVTTKPHVSKGVPSGTVTNSTVTFTAT